MLEIFVNGEKRRFDQTITVSDLLQDLQLEGKRLAVECNGEIVLRSRHATTALSNGDRIEIVVAVGGG